MLLFIAVQAGCIAIVEPDLSRLWAGLPRLARWLSGAFPPDFSGAGDIARRAGETLAIATLKAAVPYAQTPWSGTTAQRTALAQRSSLGLAPNLTVAQAYPNPFLDRTTLRLELPATSTLSARTIPRAVRSLRVIPSTSRRCRRTRR